MSRELTCRVLLTLLAFSTGTAAADEPPASGATEQELPTAEQAQGTPAAANESEASDESDMDPYQRSLWQRAFGSPDLEPGYRLSFRLVNDIPLPGPLPDGMPRLVDGLAEINVVGGVARTDWTEGATPRIDTSPAAAHAEPPIWALDPAGRLRARFLSSGHLVVEKRCKRCREVWRRKWKFKVPGTILTRPLLTDNRIYFGAQDNRVYSLKKKNGHRIWLAELGDRVSEPVVLWDGKLEVESENGPPRTREVQVILVVPDGGSVIVAIDARSGREMARHDLRVEEGRLLGVPLKTPDGKILVAREKYSPSEASLMVLELDAGNRRQTPLADDDPDGQDEAGEDTPPTSAQPARRPR